VSFIVTRRATFISEPNNWMNLIDGFMVQVVSISSHLIARLISIVAGGQQLPVSSIFIAWMGGPSESEAMMRFVLKYSWLFL
jgi:hypothetical protein